MHERQAMQDTERMFEIWLAFTNGVLFMLVMWEAVKAGLL
jgi:hypothetical protein